MTITKPDEFIELIRQGDASVLEAESRRYGANAFMVLPLRSGRIAVLGHFRDLHAIVDSWDEACEAAKSIPMNVWRASASQSEGEGASRERVVPTLESTKSAGDLGL